jgi:hypothetical protein
MTACVTIDFKISICSVRKTKYKGCHVEQIAAARVNDQARDLNSCAAPATTDIAAAARQAIVKGRMVLSPEPEQPVYSTLLRSVSKQAKHVTGTADAMKRLRIDDMGRGCESENVTNAIL